MDPDKKEELQDDTSSSRKRKCSLAEGVKDGESKGKCVQIERTPKTCKGLDVTLPGSNSSTPIIVVDDSDSSDDDCKITAVKRGGPIVGSSSNSSVRHLTYEEFEVSGEEGQPASISPHFSEGLNIGMNREAVELKAISDMDIDEDILYFSGSESD